MGEIFSAFDLSLMVVFIFFVVLGLCFGSFSNVLIYRLPLIYFNKQKANGETIEAEILAKFGDELDGKIKSISFPASHCFKCKTKLKWYHNIPLFSWLFLGGKCAFCKAKISIQYPLIELFSGVLMGVCFLKEVSVFEYILMFKALSAGLLFITLLSMSIIDLRYKAAPDMLLNASVVFSLLYAFSLTGLRDAAIFAVIFLVIRWLIGKFKGVEAMGLGDIYIFACMGAVLGLNLGFLAIFISAVLTLPFFAIASRKNYELPFIPFLAAGLFVVYLFDEFALKILEMLYG